MTDTTTPTPAPANTPAPATTTNNPPDLDPNVVGASLILKDFAKTYTAARFLENQSVQVAIAVLFWLAVQGGKVPATKQDKEGKAIDIGKTISVEALTSLDAADKRKVAGAVDLFTACYLWIANQLDCGEQTAKNIVHFAARMLRVGYSLKDFNGRFDMSEGKLKLHLAERDMSAPRDTWSGFFKYNPEHLAYDPAFANRFFPGAKVAKAIDAEIDNGMGGTVTTRTWVPADVQSVIIDDTVQRFIVVEDGKGRVIRGRPGRDTFFTVTANYASHVIQMDNKRKADAQRAEEAKRFEAAKLAAGSDSVVGGNREDRPEGETPEQEAARKASEQKAPDADKAPGTTTPEGTDKAPEGPTPPPVTDADKPGAAPSGQTVNPGGAGSQVNTDTPKDAPKDAPQDRRVHDDQSRGDAPKLDDAWTPQALRDHGITMFQPERIKTDKAVRDAAVDLYVALNGVLTAAGFVELLAHPTDPAIVKEAKAGITVSSPQDTKARTAGKNKPTR